MRKTMSDRGVRALKVRPQRYAVSDPELTGLWIRVQPSGAKSYAAVARTPAGKQLWVTIGATDAMPIAAAREQARTILQRVRAGLPPIEPKADSFGTVAGNWLTRHVDANRLRSAAGIKRLLNVHVLPTWRDREITSIRRSDVAALLDRVQDNHGARQADYVLNVVRSMMNWYSVRHDEFRPPIVRGMKRQQVAARARVLDDTELCAIWQQAESNGTFGDIVRLCLLTAQRSRKVSSMRWADLSGDEWTVPKEPREKGTGGTLLLPMLALDIISKRNPIGDNPHVFAGRGNDPFVGYGTSKVRFDAKLSPGTPRWTVHDLRRSARSLMSRAGVQSDHAERVMGHAIGGIEGVYDRHSYKNEKADALRRLASLIHEIVHPRSADLVPMYRRKRLPAEK